MLVFMHPVLIWLNQDLCLVFVLAHWIMWVLWQ